MELTFTACTVDIDESASLPPCRQGKGGGQEDRPHALNLTGFQG